MPSSIRAAVLGLNEISRVGSLVKSKSRGNCLCVYIQEERALIMSTHKHSDQNTIQIHSEGNDATAESCGASIKALDELNPDFLSIAQKNRVKQL
jgi:hypothetical protein